ncbi:MAG: DUF4190 domain-containing protein [Pseudonocardiaceae bacterium]
MPQDSPYGPTSPGQGYQPPDYPAQRLSPALVSGHHPPPTNPLAILALALGFSCWPLAIVFGHLARRQIARSGEQGQGLATAGLVIGYLVLGLTVLTVVAVVALIGATAPTGSPGLR